MNRYRAKIFRVLEVAELPIDAPSKQQAEQCAIEDVKLFPGKFTFRNPKEDEKIRVEVEQIG